MAKYSLNLETAKVHISDGNSKIGHMINFSTLPGDAEHMLYAKGELLTDIPGTCSGCCEGCFKNCYGKASAVQHHNVNIPAWGENTLLLRNKPEEVFKAMSEAITNKKAKYLRWNVSGELGCLKELELLNDLAIKHPDVNVGIYTKNYKVVAEFLKKHGDSAPNLCINISQWHHCADGFLKAYAGTINVFEYDDSNRKWCTMSDEDKERLSKCTHCPAVLKSGAHAKTPDGKDITCDMCKRCYTKTGKVTAVYDH